MIDRILRCIKNDDDAEILHRQPSDARSGWAGAREDKEEGRAGKRQQCQPTQTGISNTRTRISTPACKSGSILRPVCLAPESCARLLTTTSRS